MEYFRVGCDVTSTDARKRIFKESDPQNIAAPRKDCGSFVDEKLQVLHWENQNPSKLDYIFTDSKNVANNNLKYTAPLIKEL